MKVIQAYRFALEPTPMQERMLWSHAGASRFAWNWGLAKCKERYDAEGKWYSAFDLQKLWNVEKKINPDLAWWSENSKCAYWAAFRDLDRALKDFIKSKKGERGGRRLGFPRFKKRGRCREEAHDAEPTAPAPGTAHGFTLPPPECPVFGGPQIDRPDLDMCSCGHRHVKIEAWGGGRNDGHR